MGGTQGGLRHGIDGSRGGDGLRVLTLRPRRSLARSIGLQIVIVALPLVGIGAWSVQQQNAGLRSALAASAIVVFAVAVFAIFRYRRTEISISRFGIVERGFFGRINSVAARDVASVVRLELYRGGRATRPPHSSSSSAATAGACCACAAPSGIAQSWTRSHRRSTSSRSCDRPPVTVGELRRSDPGLLYWFERPIGG